MNPVPEIKSGINERLKEVSANLNLSEAPPINQKRLVTFINHFLINIVEFLDKFAKHCTNKLLIFDKQLNKIEAELYLLESKLNSIPEVADQKDVNVVLPKPEELESSPSSKEKLIITVDSLNEVTPPVLDSGEANKAEVPTEDQKEIPENPELARFRKMVQFGVPVQAVKIKMQIEGLDPNLIDS